MLAAGYSSRMGAFKPLLELGGRTFLERCVAAFRQAGVEDVVVVTGHRAEELRAAARGLGVRVALNGRYPEGMYTSVQAGLAASVPSPSSLAVRREQAVLLADALASLSADYREVFVLRNLEHMPVEAIALRMGRSPNAVRKLWGRALVALKHALEEQS